MMIPSLQLASWIISVALLFLSSGSSFWIPELQKTQAESFIIKWCREELKLKKDTFSTVTRSCSSRTKTQLGDSRLKTFRFMLTNSWLSLLGSSTMKFRKIKLKDLKRQEFSTKVSVIASYSFYRELLIQVKYSSRRLMLVPMCRALLKSITLFKKLSILSPRMRPSTSLPLSMKATRQLCWPLNHMPLISNSIKSISLKFPQKKSKI